VKNGNDRLVVLNRVARSVIDEVRGNHPEFVFTYRGHRVTKINNSAWKCARERAADQLESASALGLPSRAGSRSQAHVRATVARCGRFIRGPTRPARSPEWTHHNALLAGGAREPDHCSGKSLFAAVPQNSRIGSFAEECARWLISKSLFLRCPS
jgi:hypothetical protein